MSVRTFFRKYPWLIELLLALLLLNLVLSIATARDPVEILGYEIGSPLAYAGEPVEITFQINRRRVCQATATSWWENESGKEVMKLPLRSPTSAKQGITEATIRIPTPLQTGQMCYRSKVHHICEHSTYTIETPPVCMQIFPSRTQ